MKIKIMMGCAGAGKSEYVKDKYGMFNPMPGYCSADTWHIYDGVYDYDPSEASNAHAACLRKYTEHLVVGGLPVLVVDNTNTTIMELAPYVRLAEAYGPSEDIEIVCVLEDRAVCCHRNTHNVPPRVVEAQFGRVISTLDDFPSEWLSYLRLAPSDNWKLAHTWFVRGRLAGDVDYEKNAGTVHNCAVESMSQYHKPLTIRQQAAYQYGYYLGWLSHFTDAGISNTWISDEVARAVSFAERFGIPV